MSYLVLARKWRPMTFDDLVGQEHVSRTLTNAILSGRIAHAFLFTGVRGVGKTTSARILAKSLNCEKGPTPTPCLKCPACEEIAASRDIDVQEIDGASYNGVDEVRKLQESLPYRPSRDRFKVVIVDEVHMLSSSAWNAFLKTLEEPPPHVKFIFATTEVHKVPVTILSRCQRYDFKLIPAGVIAKRLRYVLDQEQIEADEAALSLMAREAAGSMRDAMSLLDQAIAWGGSKLVGEDIARVLGVAGHGTLHDLAAALVTGDAPACLHVVARLADQGFDLFQVAKDLLEHLRDLVVVKICKDPEQLVELTKEDLDRAKTLVDGVSVDDLLRLHHGFSRGFDQMAYAPQQRSALEMLLVRLAMRPPLLPLDDILQRLGELDKRLAARAGGAGQGGAPRGGARSWQAGSVATARAVAVAPARDPSAAVARAPQLAPVEDHPSPSPRDFEAPEPMRDRSQPVPEPAAVERAPAVDPGDDHGLAAWRAIISLLRDRNAALASVLEHVVPIRVGPSEVRLGIERGSFFETQIRDDKSVDLLTRVVREYFGAPTEVALTLEDAQAGSRPTLYDVVERERRERLALERRALEQHPLVRAAVETLGARIIDVKLK